MSSGGIFPDGRCYIDRMVDRLKKKKISSFVQTEKAKKTLQGTLGVKIRRKLRYYIKILQILLA